jgi:hypothetical protein
MPLRKKSSTLKFFACNHGGLGRWAFLENVDPWDVKDTIRAFLQGENVDSGGPMFTNK